LPEHTSLEQLAVAVRKKFLLKDQRRTYWVQAPSLTAV
jgi:hypothetical protein